MARSSRHSSSHGPGRINAQATVFYRKPFDLMTPEEGQRWLEGLRDQLVRKQQRERAYLDRRAARGTHTPTDDAYEADQILERELISLLDRLLEEARKGEHEP
ncbi:hypothetical protein KSD_03870 [Ktedonobacter sp. SOSP1-85]|uniref:hypothetical protein n=1 Tax=Ktedonobacter sp. SOSP1-85 TaxID=2778367 RepID=UPI00191606AF|nr:hypothetical protein [Ktedonobacter sp. SOSP1-85]GHO72616.1 hypothetical protein KSD_03870 [Ktedonobacter sp. SOSP1-85]